MIKSKEGHSGTSALMGSQNYYIKGAKWQRRDGAHRSYGNLKTYEIERKAREEMAPQKKKMIAFKSTPIISDDDDEEEDMKNSPLSKKCKENEQQGHV